MAATTRARPQLLAELVEAWAQTDVGGGQPSGALTEDQVCQALAAGASPRLLASIRLMTALDADATMSAARARRVADAVARDLALIATIPSPRHRYEAARELAAEVSVLAKAPGLADLHRRAAAMRDELQRTVEIRNELLAAARSAHPIPADTLRAGREWLHAAASPADIQRIVDTTSLARNPATPLRCGRCWPPSSPPTASTSSTRPPGSRRPGLPATRCLASRVTAHPSGDRRGVGRAWRRSELEPGTAVDAAAQVRLAEDRRSVRVGGGCRRRRSARHRCRAMGRSSPGRRSAATGRPRHHRRCRT
jgi:hypothetical protein